VRERKTREERRKKREERSNSECLWDRRGGKRIERENAKALGRAEKCLARMLHELHTTILLLRHFLTLPPSHSLPSTTACTTGLVAGPFGAAIGFFVGKNAGQGKAEQKAAAARLGLTPEVMLAIEELDSEVVATRADYELVQGARESARRRLQKLQADAVCPNTPNISRKQGKYLHEAPRPRPQALLKP
jgi:hypothetical protein